METFHEVINLIGLLLNVLGSLVIVWGILLATFTFIAKEIFNRAHPIKTNESIRLRLSSYLVLGLEFFIAGDIVKTVITPTWESIGMLASIVVIRTVLNYFLSKELKNK